MPGQFMASNLMDRTVYGSDGNSLGDINDVIVDRNGNIAAVVIGVGGFLGIGEKDVAVPFNRLQVMAREQARAPGATNTAPGTSGMAGSTTGTTGMTGGDGFWANFTDESRLVLSATRDELRNAPTFRENVRGGTARTGTGTTTTPGGTPTR
jgi:sporulation protein YlmC with PRC-barrel domain